MRGQNSDSGTEKKLLKDRRKGARAQGTQGGVKEEANLESAADLEVKISGGVCKVGR